MSKLKEVLVFFLTNYPNKEDLSNARVTKMVYLSDWKNTLIRGEQITEINWYFDNYGPFVWDVKNEITADPELFSVVETTNFFGEKKNLFRIIRPYPINKLSQNEINVLNHVIGTTLNLNWQNFIRLVYSTYPVLSSERYSYLNLCQIAQKYQNSNGN
jgi:hypothetical protein